MDDDDLYGGYTDSSYALNAMAPDPAAMNGGAAMPVAGRPLASSAGRGLGTAARGMTAAGGDPSGARPMTSMKAAGFSSAPKGFNAQVANIGVGKGPAPALQKRSEIGPEEECRDLERKVNDVLEESAEASVRGEASKALELAREAGKKERQLSKKRETLNLTDQMNYDLTYAVCFNLAHQYHMNHHYQEALSTYTSIVKMKQFGQSGRLRVNMGNIYFEQGKYPNAIKMYRMALDQVPNTAKEVRVKIRRNIGLGFVKQGLYHDATQSFEMVMEQAPDVVAGLNLVLCYRALGDKDKMKKAFLRLLSVVPVEDEDADIIEQEEVSDDALKDEERKRQSEVNTAVSTAARLIAPVIEKSGLEAGYQWVVDQLNGIRAVKLANEMEMDKAVSYLREKNFEKAVSVLKEFEKKEHALLCKAATNLSFLYFLESDLAQAEKYAEIAVSADRYSAAALVNRGNCLVRKGTRDDLEAARTLFLEAVGVEADCVEAIYNLGLVDKELENFDEALLAFQKLNTIMPNNVEAIYQVANCHDLLGDYQQAIKTFEMLNMRVQNDPGVLARLGAIYSKLDDEGKALHFYSESHRVYPVNMDVISWLGAFYVKSEVYEKAIPFFDLASQIQPQETKWSLMVASCYRRIGALAQALAKYKDIHEKSPDNVECLRYLVHLCTDLNKKDEVHDYVVKLRKAERAAEQAAPGGMDAGGLRDATPSPGAGGKQTGRKAAVRSSGGGLPAKDDDDDWGGGGLGEDLLPGI